MLNNRHVSSMSGRYGDASANRSDLFSGGSERRKGLASSGECEVEMDPLQNGQLLDLSHKVSEIRNLALNIENEVKEQNTFLDEFQNTLSQTTESLRATTGRLTKLIEEGGGNAPLCYLVAFITFVFLVLYYFARPQ